MQRKIVQICAAGEKSNLVALADDGTLWVRTREKATNANGASTWKIEWRQLESLPANNSNFGKVKPL